MAKCAKGCKCGNHRVSPRCPVGCTCKRHSGARPTCPPGCTCGRHRPFTAERRARISAALTGRPVVIPKCPFGCTCGKHGHTSGEFKPGSAGFTGKHTEETRAKLASYTGPKASAYKHGWSQTPTYNTWRGMWGRCTDPRNASYPYYGARGITVCDRWVDFAVFLADMGPRPQGKTLDRLDNSQGYEPSNCRWATRAEQDANKSNPWDDPGKRERILAGQRRART